MKKEWQTGRPWLVSAGESDSRYRAKCLACNCIFASKLTGIKGHGNADKHRALMVKWEAEKEKKQI